MFKPHLKSVSPAKRVSEEGFILHIVSSIIIEERCWCEHTVGTFQCGLHYVCCLKLLWHCGVLFVTLC